MIGSSRTRGRTRVREAVGARSQFMIPLGRGRGRRQGLARPRTRPSRTRVRVLVWRWASGGFGAGGAEAFGDDVDSGGRRSGARLVRESRPGRPAVRDVLEVAAAEAEEVLVRLGVWRRSAVRRPARDGGERHRDRAAARACCRPSRDSPSGTRRSAVEHLGGRPVAAVLAEAAHDRAALRCERETAFAQHAFDLFGGPVHGALRRRAPVRIIRADAPRTSMSRRRGSGDVVAAFAGKAGAQPVGQQRQASVTVKTPTSLPRRVTSAEREPVASP